MRESLLRVVATKNEDRWIPSDSPRFLAARVYGPATITDPR